MARYVLRVQPPNLNQPDDVEVSDANPLPTTATFSGTLTATDVAIHDGTTATQKLKVNADGSINTNATPVADQLVHAANLDLAISALRDALRGASNKTLSDVVAALASVPVTGTFFQATQPVSESHLPNLDVAMSTRLKPGDGVRLQGDNASTPNPVFAFPAGFLRTTDEPHSIFYDPFDGALDTVNLWNAALTSGGGVAGFDANGALNLGSGTNPNSYSSLESQPRFTPTVPGWMGVSSLTKLPNTAAVYSFIGAGTQPASPTPAAPLTDAFGFEVSATDSHLYAVTYASGVRTQVADLGAAGVGKNDGGWHRFIVYYRTDRIFWYIDGLDVPVASTSFAGPVVQTLPAKLMVATTAPPPSTSGVIVCSGYAVWDSAKNSSALKDGRYGWRTASVDSSSRLAATDRYTGLEAIADFVGNGASQAKTFTSATDCIWVLAQGGTARVTSSAQTPTASLGVPCLDGVPTPIPFSPSDKTIRVFAAGAVTISSWAQRY